MERKIMKRAWTSMQAKAYIVLAMNGAAPKGLKYCSALDYLRGQGKLEEAVKDEAASATA